MKFLTWAIIAIGGFLAASPLWAQDSVRDVNARFVNGQINRLQREIHELEAKSRQRLPQPWLVDVVREQIAEKREALRRATEFQEQQLESYNQLGSLVGQIKWYEVFGVERPAEADQRPDPIKSMRLLIPDHSFDCQTAKIAYEHCIRTLRTPRQDRNNRPPGRCQSNESVLCVPGGDELLRALNIDLSQSIATHADLTVNFFTRPQVQMGRDNTRGVGCVGFSLAQSMNMHLARMSAGGFLLEVSPWDTYRSILQPDLNTCVRARDQNDIGVQTALHIENAIHSLARAPVCGQESDMRIGLTQGVATTEANLSIEDLKRLTAAGYAPVIGLVTEVRDSQEEWIQFRYPGHIGHAITLVGFDRGLNPFTLQEEDYFLVIDSLTPAQRNWPLKVSARNLLQHLDMVAQIRSLSIQ